jgi:hypothetical protein
MKITVEVPEERISQIIQTRINELFSEDSRYRESDIRTTIHRIIDTYALEAVKSAKDRIELEIPTMASEAVKKTMQYEMDKTAKRGFGALSKLYSGFDPAKLTQEQRAWLEKQITEAAKK